MILVLISIGKFLESISKEKTIKSIQNLIDLTPKTAIVLRNGKETEIPASEILKGEIFIVKTGGIIPADGIIIEGNCAVDESSLTGESFPVDKEKGR